MQKKEPKKLDLDNNDVEKIILKFRKSRDKRLRNKILSLNSCKAIASSAAAPFYNSNLYEDLKQDAFIGIVKAIDNYRKGGNFYACASIYAKREIYNKYHQYVCPVKISPLSIRKNKLITKFISEFYDKTGRTPTNTEISKGTRIKESKIDSFLNLNKTIPIEEISEVLPEKKNKDNTPELECHLNDLSDIEKFVINESFGIKNEPQTLSKIAQKLGKTKQRISQIRIEALKKLKKGLSSKIS